MKYQGQDNPQFGIKNGEDLNGFFDKMQMAIMANLTSRNITVNKFDYNPHNGNTVIGLTDGSEYELKGIKRANPKPPKPDPFNPKTTNAPFTTSATFYKDVAYGEDKKQVLDVFVPKSSKPTGIAVFIHGGGFSSQSKEFFYSGTSKKVIQDLLNQGVAVASINYRFIQPKGETIGIRKCWEDAVSSVNFLNEKSSFFNLEKENIVTVGASSGAGLAMLVGYSSSVNVKGVLALETQAGYDVPEWDRDVFSSIRNFTQSNVNSIVGVSTLLAVYGANSMSDLETPKYIAYRNEVSVLKDFKKDSPELYVMSFQVPNVTPKNVNELYHHPLHAKTLYDQAIKKGMKVKALLPTLRFDTTNKEDLVSFLIRKLNE